MIFGHAFHDEHLLRIVEEIEAGRYTDIELSACAAAGCPGASSTTSAERRSAISRPRGIPQRVAMQTTGHKARAVFGRYNVVSAGDLREAAARLDAATGTISGQSSTIGDRGQTSEIRKSLCDNT